MNRRIYVGFRITSRFELEFLTRILTRSRNFWRNTRSNTRLTSVARTSFRGKFRGTSRTLFRLSWKGPRSVRLSRYTRGGAASLSLSSRRRALRGIPPLVQPLPFATCRRRSVRERILACLRHFSKKRLAVFCPAPIRSGTATCNIVSLLRLFYESGKTWSRITVDATRGRNTVWRKAESSVIVRNATGVPF